MTLISDFISVPGSSAKRRGSVLLQQASRRERTMLMACVSDERGGDAEGGDGEAYAVGRMQGWYRETAMDLGLSGCSETRMERELGNCLQSMKEELMAWAGIKKESREISFTGILACGCRFWLFQLGNTRAYLMNHYFMRPHIRRLTSGEQGVLLGGKDKPEYSIQVRSGSLEDGAGILLCSDGLYGFVPEHVLKECLFPREISQSRQIGKRLGELAQEAVRRGCTDHISAVYLKSQGGKDAGKEDKPY